MALSVQFHGAPDQGGEVETFLLCSIGAWGHFGAWAESLPPECGAVKALVTKGEVKGTDELGRQLRAALDYHAPPPGVRNTARQLLDNLGEGDSEETATVTDD